MERTKKLIAGQTVIGYMNGQVNGVFHEFTVLYGNVLTPFVNGEVPHLDYNKEYLPVLGDFLESEEGQEYIVPSESECIEAFNLMLTREAKARERKEKEQKAQENQEVQETQEPQQVKPTTEDAVGQDKPTGEETAKFTTPEDDPDADAPKEVDEEIEETEEKVNEVPQSRFQKLMRKKKNDKPIVETTVYRDSDEPANDLLKKKIKGLKITMIVCTLLIILSSVASSFLPILLASEDTVNLTVDGTTMKIPKVQVNEGQTNISYYAITTTVENGETHTEVLPLGEVEGAIEMK